MKNRLFKTLSLLLTIVMVFSVCVIVESTAFAQAATYYVKKYGSDSAAGTASAPLATVSKAIEKAKNAGFKAGDTVTVRLMEFPTVSWGENIEYDFNLLIKSDSSSLRSTVAIPDSTEIAGDITFEKVIIDEASTLFFNNKNISVDTDCIIMANEMYFGASSSDISTVSGQSVVLDASLSGKQIVLADKNTTEKTYSGDVNLVVKNEKSTPTVYVSSNSGKTVFESNLNINIMNAPSVSFAKSGTTTVNGAVQLVVNSDTLVSDDSLKVLSSLNASGGFYHIVNATRVENMITVTDTAGKYIVNTERYDIYAEDENGNIVQASNGYLTLSNPGQYEVTAVKDIEKPVYYVSSSGKSSNSGLSKSDPLSSVAEVISKANEAGYWGGDTVTVRIISQTATWGTTENYEFLLSVRSDDTDNISTLTIPTATAMTGDVEFKYLKIPNTEKFPAFDNSVTMTKSVEFNPQYLFIGYANKTTTVKKEINVILKNKFNGYLQTTNDSYAGKTYTKDVTVSIDNAKSTPRILFVTYWGGTTTFKGNLNIEIKNAKSVSFGPTYVAANEVTTQGMRKAVAEKAVHLIVNSDVEMDAAVL